MAFSQRRHLLVSLSIVTVALLGACGGGGGSDKEPSVEASDDNQSAEKEKPASLQEFIRTSATKAAGIDSSRIEMRASLPGPDGQPAQFTITGAVDNAKGLASMEMDMGSMVPGMSGTMTMLLQDTVMYMRFPAEMGAPKPWMKIDLAAAGEMAGMDFGALMAQAKQSDPKAMLGLLSGASDDAVEVGTEDVRGVSTRHFKMTVDLQRALDQGPAEVKEAMKDAVEMLGIGSYPAEVWIDDENLPRRFKFSMDMSKAKIPGAEALPGTMTLDMEMFDYGVDVKLDLPPAGEVMDMAEFLGEMGGTGN